MNKPFNKYFDHTQLKADAKPEDVKKLCREALEYDFYAVCVNSLYIPLVASLLKGSQVKVASVVGFPLGAVSTACKVYETDWACEMGADEIDMVVPLGYLLAGDYDEVMKDISLVNKFAKEKKALVKVILETCLLDKDLIVKGCQLAMEAGVDFVKTSTGFSSAGASIEDVKLMRKSIGNKMQLKASGGIRDLDTALKMIEAGADRLGASASVVIMEEYLRKGNK